MTDQWFVIPVNPQPWAIGPVGYARRSGKMSAYVGRNNQLEAFEQAVKEEVMSASPIMHEGRVKLTIYVWRKRNAYTTPQARTHRKHEADATNMLKAIEDALQGVLFKNDRDNKDVRLVVMEQGEKAYPCIAIHTEDWEKYDPEELPADVWTAVTRAQLFQGISPKPTNNVWSGPDA